MRESKMCADRATRALLARQRHKRNRDAGLRIPHATTATLPLQVDITSDEAVQAAAKEVDDAFEGQLDILVNNAGYLPELKPIHESDPIEWWKAWDINVKGTFLSCHYLIPLVSQSDTRIVINMSSIGGNCLTYGGRRTRRRGLRIADSRSS